jgi:hypothetical protein
MKEIANHVHVIILFRVLAFVPPMLHCLMAHITYSSRELKTGCHQLMIEGLQSTPVTPLHTNTCSLTMGRFQPAHVKGDVKAKAS